MSEALFPSDLAVAELRGSVRAPEFDWILADAKSAIAALADENAEGRVPALQLRRIISMCQRVNSTIAPGMNVLEARNALRTEIGLDAIAVDDNAEAHILPPDWKPKIPQALRSVDE